MQTFLYDYDRGRSLVLLLNLSVVVLWFYFLFICFMSFAKLGDEDMEAESIKPDAWRLMKMNSPEWPYIIGGTISATVNGCIQPMFAFIFSEVLGVRTRSNIARESLDILAVVMTT